MSPERQARAERLGPYFELQLRLARRMAELTGAPLGEMALRHTNFHRKFGLGRGDHAVAPAWGPYAAALERTSDLSAQVALTQATFLAMPPEVEPLPPKIAFGCFAHDAPNAEGRVQIHFHNLDTDDAGGPLAAAKIGRRRAELAAMIGHIRAEHPEAVAIKGRSWLYNLEAYRRLFPPQYGASAVPAEGRTNLHGHSVWGQSVDAWERVRPEVRDHLLGRLDELDPEAPWRIFPLRVLSTVASIDSFEAFLGSVG